MNKTRYMYRKYLTEYDLDTELFHIWGVEVDDLYPLRKVFIIKSGDKKYILKNIDYDKHRYSFLNNSLEYVRRNYNNIVSNKKSINGNIVEEYNGKYYMMINLIEGRECSMENPIDLAIAAKGLAEFHRAGAGIELVTSSEDLCYDNIEESFKKNKELLQEILDMVSRYKYKNYFDQKFVDNSQMYIDDIDRCIDSLKKVDFGELNHNRDVIVLCHNDLAYHNILIKDDKPFFIDFDYSNINYRVKDLAQFIVKSIKNSDYDIKMYNAIMSNYESVIKLSDNEKKLLKVLLMYPSDIINIITNYYFKRKKWTDEAFNSVLNLKMNQERSKKEFIDKFF